MSLRPVVAIHQPNFLPWLGYFDKMARADTFVYLDDVQFSKGAGGTGSWVNRVRILVGGQPWWATVPVVRAYTGLREIREMEIDERTPWRAKLLRTIEQSYRRAPFFEIIFPTLKGMLEPATGSLLDLNLAGLRSLATLLGLDASRMVASSALGAVGTSTERLVTLVRATGGSAYLCGNGAAGYQSDPVFANAGVELLYQPFLHPEYVQGTPDFHAGLSAVDALMRCGPDATRAMLGKPVQVADVSS